jgi:hypothetical protein
MGRKRFARAWVGVVKLTSMGPKVFELALSSAKAVADELPAPMPIHGGFRVWVIAQDEWEAHRWAKHEAYPDLSEEHNIPDTVGIPEPRVPGRSPGTGMTEQKTRLVARERGYEIFRVE